MFISLKKVAFLNDDYNRSGIYVRWDIVTKYDNDALCKGQIFRLKNIENDETFQTQTKYGMNRRNYSEKFQFKVISKDSCAIHEDIIIETMALSNRLV